MIEVQVENFQSITKAAFKIDGFTALVGRSNIGKSALVRAFRNALTGAQGTDFVRHGPSCERRLKEAKKCKCQTTVRISTPKVAIVWEKGDAVNRYTVTHPGEPPVLYDKVNRGTPEFLSPDFSPLKVGDETELVQVSEQFNPIFLLNASGPAVADVLSDVARLDDINEATRLVVKDRKDAAATRTVREKDVAELVRNLATYDGLDLAVEDVGRVEAKYTSIQERQRQLSNVNRLVLSLETVLRSIRSLQVVTSQELPNSDNLQTTSTSFTKVVRFEAAWGVRTAAIDRLSGIDSIELPSVAPVQDKLKELGTIEEWIRRVQAVKANFDRLKALEGVSDPTLKPLEETRSRFLAVESLTHRLQAIVTSIQSLQEQVQEAEKEEASALEQLQALGICPTCSQSVGANHRLHLEAS